MSETGKHLKEQFDRGKQLGEDKSISAGDAVRQIMGEARAEFQAASNYTKMRNERKQNVAKRLQSGYEIGKNEPNVEALVRFADLYGVSMDYLTCRTDE